MAPTPRWQNSSGFPGNFSVSGAFRVRGGLGYRDRPGSTISMSMSQTYAPHLPYLRRYARALAGSQSSGDTYVRAALSALLAGEQKVIEGVSPRVGLYQVFHAIWSSASGRVENGAP